VACAQPCRNIDVRTQAEVDAASVRVHVDADHRVQEFRQFGIRLLGRDPGGREGERREAACARKKRAARDVRRQMVISRT
jgi:hypothetical protein